MDSAVISTCYQTESSSILLCNLVNQK